MPRGCQGRPHHMVQSRPPAAADRLCQVAAIAHQPTARKGQPANLLAMAPGNPHLGIRSLRDPRALSRGSR
eukprot:4226805-Heterocapsa_arctica.AAC.1